MRIVVFSDSHNNYYALKNIVLTHMGAECFIHLGDGERDVQDLRHEFPDKAICHVRGNCDWASQAPENGILEFGGKRIVYTHGHLHAVKSGLEALKLWALGKGADIVLYGHTHQAYTEYDEGLYIMNPGSVTSPRGGAASYGMIDITEAGIVLNIVEL